MYLPPAFREDRRDVVYDAIRAHPLGTLITAGPSGLIANVLPFSLRCSAGHDVLRAHLAKANDQVADLRLGTPALVVFQGPQAYVSPSWYPPKQEHGKVVPTWNYVAQASGISRVIEDMDWLTDQLGELTAAHESGRPEPWEIEDAPGDFIAGQMKGIVGLEISLDRIEGKWKVSQNQPIPNRAGVVDGLRNDGHSDLADFVVSRSDGN